MRPGPRGLHALSLSVATITGFAIFPPVNSRRLRAQASPPTATPLPSFEVASIKPNHSSNMMIGIRMAPGRFVTTGSTAKQLIDLAYDIRDFQISGGPAWIGSDKYDIDAKEPDELAAQLMNLPDQQRREKLGLLVQSLLTDRFQLKVHRETKELPVYALVIAKNGPKLQAAKPGETYGNGIKTPDGHPTGGRFMRMRPGELDGQGTPMAFLVQTLSQQLGQTVMDQTGLKGNYDFTLKWTPDPGSPGMMPGPPPGAGPGPDKQPPPPDASGPSLFTAVQEQLGLKLQSTKGAVSIIVIDHIERPSEN